MLISFTGEGYDPSQGDIVQPNSSVVSNDSNDFFIPSSSSSHLLTSSQVSCHSNLTVCLASAVDCEDVARNDQFWSFPVICYY